MRIHFIGIGGIGVSALARYYLARGFEASGSDVAESKTTNELEKLGAKIFVGHKKQNLANLSSCDDGRIIYSAAVEENNLELVEARRRGVKCQTYAQALGELTKKYFTIAVSGTHGKSTTTAMIGLILEAAGLDPTVIVGTKVREWNNSNFRLGKSRYLVIEADEYSASFLNYWPKIIVLTNIEEDHLDYYKNLEHIKKAFYEYINHLDGKGVLVSNNEDKNIQDLISNFQFPISNKIPNSKFQIQNYCASEKIEGLKLQIPGKHNLSNAAAAITVARLLKIPDKISIKTLNNFSGTWRRMEYKGKINGARIYDDYGHHPTEIKATLQGARELLAIGNKRFAMSDRRLWCVFQPHQFQRTYQLFDKFVNAFGDADKVILLPIYSVAGREKEEIKKKVNSEKLVVRLKAEDKSKDVIYLNNFDRAKKYLMKNIKKGDVCVIMGAGDIYKLTEILLKS